MIVIVDYGTGNLGSIRNMLKKLGAVDVMIGSTPEELLSARQLVLPGVGSFDMGMSNLRDRGLEPILNTLVLDKKIPILGICLGMQLLLDGSDEGQEPGLGWVKGRNIRFCLPAGGRLKVPHMGWNTVSPKSGSKIFSGQTDEFGFYFVHSYYAKCEDESLVAGWTLHGERFACAIEQENIWGVQFHPEKSHKHGMQLMKNFLEISSCA